MAGHGVIERVFTTLHEDRKKPVFGLRGKVAFCTEAKTDSKDFENTAGETSICGDNATPGHHKNEEVMKEISCDGRHYIGDPGTTDKEGNTPTKGCRKNTSPGLSG